MAAELLTDASRALDANASPLAGATWTFYASGTTTKQSVYTTAALTTPHDNPVTADAGGKFPPIYFDATKAYRGVLRDEGGTTINDVDPINSSIMADLASSDSGKGASLVKAADGRTLQQIFTALASSDGAEEIGASILDADSVSITLQDWLRDQVILPRQFGVVGDGTTDDTAAMVKFFAAIQAGKKGYLPAGCWPKITAQILTTFSNLQHFYLEGAGSEVCGIRFSGTAAPFLRFDYANLFNAVHFRNLTLAVDTADDASGCISLYGVGHGAPGNAAQNDFTDVVWRGWDGRIQTHYWGNCLYTELVSNVMIRGGGSWGPNDADGKGSHFIFTGDALDANPYAVHFDFDTVYLTQFEKGITVGAYAQGLTLKAVNMNRGDYGVYIASGQVANDIITVGGGSQFNCNVASIGCFEDEATISVSDTTFVIERAGAVGIRTASRWGRFSGNHFQGIGSPASSAGIHCISGADRNIIVGNVFSTLPLGCLYDSGTSDNVQALNRFDTVTTSYTDNGTGNVIGTITA